MVDKQTRIKRSGNIGALIEVVFYRPNLGEFEELHAQTKRSIPADASQRYCFLLKCCKDKNQNKKMIDVIEIVEYSQ